MLFDNAPLLDRSAGDLLRRTGIDADRLTRRLWQGSRAPVGKRLRAAGFDVLVLCAEEYQPPSSAFPGVHVIHAGIDDAVPTTEELRIVRHASRRVAECLEDGARVLVTCQAGWNRSGFVSAMAIHRLTGMPGRHCIELVRASRANALQNRAFCRVLETL